MLIFALLLSDELIAQCPTTPTSHAQLQWSEATKLVSPNHSWEVEVRPVLNSNENESPVQLHRCERLSVPRTLLKLERNAEAYWRPDSKMLLIVNQPVANAGKVLLFESTSASPKAEDLDNSSNQIDEVVKKRLSDELGYNRQIEFYLPQFVSWKSADLVIAVGGATTLGGAGTMTPYCYGFVIDSDTRRIRKMLSAKGLKAEFGKECQVSP